MKICLIGFALVFLGFLIGVVTVCLCVAGGRADETMEKLAENTAERRRNGY